MGKVIVALLDDRFLASFSTMDDAIMWSRGALKAGVYNDIKIANRPATQPVYFPAYEPEKR